MTTTGKRSDISVRKSTPRRSWRGMLNMFSGAVELCTTFIGMIPRYINPRCVPAVDITPDETADHIILCPEQGRTNLYNDSVNDLVRWTRKETTHPTIIPLIRGYLRARGRYSDLLRPCYRFGHRQGADKIISLAS